MKQNTINSFQGGLNFDLTPLATPNNVLTDALNATFVTFNGDELILQNDSGNTDLKYFPDPEDPEVFEKVKLPQNYYPLAIKEHGGVLYILSATDSMHTDTSTLYINGTNYNSGIFVYNSNFLYYKCKTSGIFPLPLDGSDTNWEYVGDLSAYKNYRGFVEFGSFPSPQFAGISTFNGLPISKTEVQINDLLYKQSTINNTKYKSGRYIQFDNNTINSTYISSYNFEQYVPRFYKVKLYQQLTNGFLDLTDDVWKKYRSYKAATLTPTSYWFNDSGFKYYCPNQFKGKLSISIEIENLLDFSLKYAPEIIFRPQLNPINNYYSVKFTVNAIGDGSIVVPQVYFQIFLNGIAYSLPNSGLVNVSANEAILNFNLPSYYQNATLTYNITPIIQVNSINITQDLPDEYKNQYIITGELLISTILDLARFEKVESNTSCFGNNQRTQIYNEYILKNSNGNYLNNNLDISETPYIFLRSGTSAVTPNSILIANYNSSNNINNVLPTIVLPTILEIDDLILNNFEQTVNLYSSNVLCGVEELIITLDRAITYPFTETNKIEVSQNGDPISGEPLDTNNKSFRFWVTPTIDSFVSIEYEAFENIVDTFAISIPTEKKYATIANLYTITTAPNEYWAVWDFTNDIDNSIISLNLQNNSGDDSPVDLIYNSGINWESTVVPHSVLRIIVTEGVTIGSLPNWQVTHPYGNLSVDEKFIGGTYFRTLYSL